MADGFKVIEDQIAILRGFEDFVEESTSDIRDIIWKDIEQNVKEGRGPDGKLWQRTREGKAPLRTAMSGLRSTAFQGTITVRIEKRHLVLHHHGYARGNVARPILPDTITPRMTRKIRAYFDRKMAARMAGAQ